MSKQDIYWTYFDEAWKKVIDKIVNKDILKKYHRLAARCNSLDEFKKMLNGNN